MIRTDRDAEFVEFVAEHRSTLLRTARLLAAGDDGLAEDLVQSTLTKLYVNWARVRRAESQIAYARRALTNTFIDEGRRPYRRSEQQVAEPEAGSEPTRRAADPATTQTLLAALAELPPRQRAVVVLRHWLDLDIARTAELLNCSEGTVKSQNAKAVQHLRAALPHTLIGELP